MTSSACDPLFGPRGRLLLAVGCWLLFAALTVGLGFSLREGGVLADGRGEPCSGWAASST